MNRPLICLVMIVKNEARGIRETLESVKPFVDRYCLVDTGSTDGTPDIMRATMAGVEGAIHVEPFVDFGATRNRALELAGTECVFTLMLSGDETLDSGEQLRAFCEEHRHHHAGAYFVPVRLGAQSYDSARLARSEGGWRYVGATHEVLCGPHGSRVDTRVDGAFIKHDVSHRDPEGQRRNGQRDLLLLSQDHAARPDDTRTTFYLAQTQECLGDYDHALATYSERVALGWTEEVYEAMFRIARVQDRMGTPWAPVQQAYLDTYAFSPDRAEPLCAIAQHWCDAKNWPLTFLFATMGAKIPYPAGAHLFVDAEVYTIRLSDLIATSAYYVGERELGKAAAAYLVVQDPVNERYRRNLDFYLSDEGAANRKSA